MKRIDFIAEQTKGYDTVIDIGCDHGLVLKKAFQKGYIKKAIASDLREKPLLSAKKNLSKYPVKYYLTSGFKDISDEFDLAVICGMGANLISEIILDSPHKNKHFLLGAHDRIEELRSFLCENDFLIIDEKVIFDKFYYVFMKVTKGNMELSYEDILLGPVLKTQPNTINYYENLFNYYKELTGKVNLNKKSIVDNKIEILEKHINQIRKV